MTGHIDINLFIYERSITVSEKKVETEKGFTITVTSDDPEKVETLKAKMKSCCDSSDSFEETEKGFTISVTSDDPEKVEKLKAELKSCCDSSDSKPCC